MPMSEKKSPSNVAAWQAQLRAAMFEALGADEIRAIVNTLITKAKAGDIAAARLLLTYAVGQPGVNVKNAVIVNGDAHALPTAPTKALPGTSAKLDVLAARARNGKELFDRRDKVDYETESA